MRKITLKHKLDWIERMDLPTDAYWCQQWLDKLDSEFVQYEARWGCGVLPKLVSLELNQKWQAQMEKLEEALLTNNVKTLPDLVEGAIRGLTKLENEAMERGHKPHGAPVAWTVRMSSGRELMIAASHRDASMVQGNLPKGHECAIWSLEEIACFIEKHGLFNPEIKSAAANYQKPSDFDFGMGDKLPEGF